MIKGGITQRVVLMRLCISEWYGFKGFSCLFIKRYGVYRMTHIVVIGKGIGNVSGKDQKRIIWRVQSCFRSDCISVQCI